MSIAYPTTPGVESVGTEQLKAKAVTGPKIAEGAIEKTQLANEKANLTLTAKVTSVGEPIAMIRVGNLVFLRGQFKIESAIKAAEEFASLIAGYRPVVPLSEIPIRSTIGTEKKLAISTAGVLTLSAETAAETYNLDVAIPLL